MRILVIGATGMIGSRIVTEAFLRGHDIIAASRKAPGDNRDNVDALTLDINDTAAVKAAAQSADIVISAVSPRSGGDQTREATAFTQSLITALGQKRLLLVGGAGSLFLEDGSLVLNVLPEQYKSEATAMLASYDLLNASALNFTVLAPAAVIAPGRRTGKARVGDRTLVTDKDGKSEISAEDFAVILLDEVETPLHQGKIFNAAY